MAATATQRKSTEKSAGKRRSGADRPAEDGPASAAEQPLTVSRDELLSGGSDREFRQFVHRLLAFSARLETIRTGFGARLGLTGIQYSALIAVAHLSRDQDIGVKEVADHLALSGSFATLVIGQLVEIDLIDKAINPKDRRRVCLTVTDNGAALLSKLSPTQCQVNDLLFEPLDAETFRRLNDVFAKLLDSADAAVGLAAYLSAPGNGTGRKASQANGIGRE